ncbi:hypothetical protein LTR15_006601 [Elasticomyces elasticus]|nr:hypothetical protein LTR15_006601 [Elasticomyces elasticus]
MTTISAAARVFGTPELLETILLQLDTRKGWTELLLSQRVCQTFKVTIGSSHRLQEILHFRVSAASVDDAALQEQSQQVLRRIFHPPRQVNNGAGLEVSIFPPPGDYHIFLNPWHPAVWDPKQQRRKALTAVQLAGSKMGKASPMHLGNWRGMVLRKSGMRVYVGCSHATPSSCAYEKTQYCHCFGKIPFCTEELVGAQDYHMVKVPGGIQEGETVEGLLRRLWPCHWL